MRLTWRLLRYMVLWSALIIGAQVCPAQLSQAYNYTYYRTSDGLCDEYVFKIFRDSRGFVWFCTSNGLDRFDGGDFVHYSTTASMLNHRTKSNFFRSIQEDDHGFMWAISDIGLMRISPVDGTIVHASEVYDDCDGLLSRGALAIEKDAKGSLWVGMEDYVLHILLGKDGNISDMEEFLVNGDVINAFCQQENTIWAGGRNGLSRFILSSDGHSLEVPLEDDHELKAIKNVRTLASRGAYLHIGTTDSGLYLYNLQTRNIRQYLNDPKDTNSLSSNFVSSIGINMSGDLVIGTRNGVNILSHGNKFVRLMSGIAGASLTDNQVNHIFVDVDDNIWAGTALGGVNVISIRKSNIIHLFGEREGGRSNVITALFRDNDDNLLCGINGGGLGVIRAGTTDAKYYRKDYADDNSLSDNNVRAIIQDENGGYWIGTKNGGLNYMSKSALENPRFDHFDTRNSLIHSNSIYAFALDSVRHGIWICFDDGVQFLNTETLEFVDLSKFVGSELQMSNMMSIMLGHDGRLWIGGDGLYIVELGGDYSGVAPYFYCRYKLDEPQSGISERISVIRAIEDSTVYIESQCNGLYVCKLGPDRQISFVNHLPVFGTKISNIVKGSNKCVWISTINGVYYFDRESFRTIKYDSSDGLPASQFYIKSGVDFPGGRACFGSVRGAVVIDPTGYLPITSERKVVVTYVLTGENNMRLMDQSTYELSPDETSIEIGLSAQEYVHPDKVMYAYKIDELDSYWTVERKAMKVRYAGMKPGKYTFLVHCTNSDNLWSSQVTKLNIIIKAPFYQTWWFYCIVILAILGIAGILAFLYYRRQKSIQKFLVAKVKQRTRSLTEQTEQLMRKNEEISEQKTRIEEFSKQIEHTNKEKLMMFTSLTHEFKTPLTLILGPVRKLIEGNDNPSLTENIQIINRNAHHLLSLVNQIMDLRMIDARHLYLSNVAFNVLEEFDGDMAAFSDILSERNIEFTTRIHIGTELIVSDRSFMHKILFNLMSNAIKYTPNGGRIVCRIAQRGAGGSDSMWQYISVSNTGSYINPEECERIFDCFYKIENQKAYTSYGQSSTGIGLYLVKELVIALGGRICVKSVEGRGTTFRVCFPVKAASESLVVASRRVEAAVQADSNFDDIPFDAPDKRDKPVVLLVEDSRDMRGYIRGILGDKYYVAEAINGERGYALARKISPDFIISDLMMPVCDGLEFCRLIRSDSELCHIPFVMLTALSDYDSRFESYKVNVDAYLTKPFEPEMLLARIDAILTNRNNQQKVIIQDLSNPYPTVEMEDSDKTFLKKLVEVMRANYSNPDFSVATLVDMMGMSAPKLYNKINALTGMSAVSYIRLFRLQTAKKIMEENRGKKGISVSEVAYLVGFNDPKYFTRCFVKQFGVQPRTFINEG